VSIQPLVEDSTQWMNDDAARSSPEACGSTFISTFARLEILAWTTDSLSNREFAAAPRNMPESNVETERTEARLRRVLLTFEAVGSLPR
jgi:hypothetical protein